MAQVLFGMTSIATRSTTRLAICLVAAAAGCGTQVSYSPLKPFEHPPRPVDSVAIVLTGEAPTCTTEVIGQISAGKGIGQEQPLVGLRAKVAELGADGAMDVACGKPGTIGMGVCTGLIYVCRP
jgi:hypothetical protein